MALSPGRDETSIEGSIFPWQPRHVFAFDEGGRPFVQKAPTSAFSFCALEADLLLDEGV